jgi:hypothetical protein
MTNQTDQNGQANQPPRPNPRGGVLPYVQPMMFDPEYAMVIGLPEAIILGQLQTVISYEGGGLNGKKSWWRDASNALDVYEFNLIRDIWEIDFDVTFQRMIQQGIILIGSKEGEPGVNYYAISQQAIDYIHNEAEQIEQKRNKRLEEARAAREAAQDAQDGPEQEETL